MVCLLHTASEKSKELFDEAMAHGYVKSRDIKALILGAAGTGKSHTIALIMDEDPPAVRRSTPCATRPVRAVSRTTAEARGSKFVRVTQDQLSQTIDPFLDAFRVFIGGQNRSQIRKLILQ